MDVERRLFIFMQSKCKFIDVHRAYSENPYFVIQITGNE